MTTRRTARAAFTLIELLVVIAIIGILMSLILPAVQKIRGTGPRLVAKSDIEQMSTACSHFKTKYGFYPPSTFTFPTTATDPGAAVFKSMFPRWAPAAVPHPGLPATITGIQCLVYFLGGPNGTGWAVDAPVAPSATAKSKEMFMDFPVARVVNGAFLDPWKTPYVYFGSTTGGGYANVAQSGVFPYNSAPGKWVNPTGVQIISAGENKVFGPGGAWAPGAGAYSNAQSPGGDDMANFNGGLMLGVLNN